MTYWRPARSLDQLLDEVNRAAPKRSKAADGCIGDPAHAARSSDHNPNPVGVVRARDFTHDPAHGLDAGVLAERIRRLGLAGHPALAAGAYVIWSDRIASATRDGAPWDWEPYAGDNPHTKHVHVSVSASRSGYDSPAPWGVMRPLEPNHVTRARRLLEQAIAELERAPRSRVVVRAGAATLRRVLAVLPKR